MVRLGINIDHVATLRQVRGTPYPDLIEAARAALDGGADFITVHLREDRRHIQDTDVVTLLRVLPCRLNLELAATPQMLAIATRLRPADVCLVPERRAELTTEGGLDVSAHAVALQGAVQRLTRAGIRVSLFIDPEPQALAEAARCGAPVVELHTGPYAQGVGAAQGTELARLHHAALAAAQHGLLVNAGHGLTLANVAPVAALPGMQELNIGHAVVARALFVGLRAAVAEMRAAMAGP